MVLYCRINQIIGSLRKGVFSLGDARQSDVCRKRTAFLKLLNKHKKLFTQSRIFLLFVVDGGNAINKILFLKVRAMKKDAATLVASGPQGNARGAGVLLGILGDGVPPGSPNPDPISDQKCHFPHPFSDQG